MRSDGQESIVYCTIRAIHCIFSRFTGVLTHAGCWENRESRIVYKSQAGRKIIIYKLLSHHPWWVSMPANQDKVQSIAII